MNKQDEKWMPEVGQRCRYRPSKHACWADVSYLAGHGDSHWLLYTNIQEPYTVTGGEFSPIEPLSDKYREEQIDYMDKILCGAIERDLSMAVELYEQGVRVLAPDEFVAKRLTEEQKKALYPIINSDDEWTSGKIDAVQTAMLGEKK